MISALDPRHGTTSGYRLGCREACCRAANAERHATYMRNRHLVGMTCIDATGTHRRLRSLMRMGWRSDDIADEAGWGDRSVPRDALRRERVTRATAARIAAVYDRLSMKPGPSRATAERAARNGWPPPLAWDDEEIDDPDAQPWTPEPIPVPAELLANDVPANLRNLRIGTFVHRRLAEQRQAALLEDVEFLLDTRTHPEVIAERLGYQLPTLYRRLERLDAADLAHRLTAAAA